MKSENKRTNTLKKRKLFLQLIHFLCLFGPLLYYIPLGYIEGELTQKISMSFSITIIIILAITAMVSQMKHKTGLHKTILWVMILSITLCLSVDRVKTFIWIMSIASILDELIITRVLERTKVALIANKEYLLMMKGNEK